MLLFHRAFLLFIRGWPDCIFDSGSHRVSKTAIKMAEKTAKLPCGMLPPRATTGARAWPVGGPPACCRDVAGARMTLAMYS